MIVADIDSDLEGEDAGGSVDVEERNAMPRTVARRADVVFAVGLPSMKGMHALVRVIAEQVGFGVTPERIVPVLNRAPRTPRTRAALTATLAELTAPVLPGLAPALSALPAPIFLPERRVDDALVDGIRLPAVLGAPLAGAFRAVLERSPARRPADEPAPVRPGSHRPLGQLGKSLTEP